MSNIKRIISLCLVFVMMFAVALPVMAAGGEITQIGGNFSQTGVQPNQPNQSNRQTHTIYITDTDNGLISSDKEAASESKAIIVEAGANKTVFIIPEAGFEVAAVLVDGVNVGALTEYTFENVNKDHNIQAVFAKTEAAPETTPDTEDTTDDTGLPFIDVDTDDWFYEAVKYTYDRDIFKGIEVDEFGYDVPLTRAMIVTVLYRVEGEPEVELANTFSDVPTDEYYAAPVEWAAANGIVLGYDGLYRPLDELKVEEAMAILNRYADFKGYEYEVAYDEIDVSELEISTWAVDNIKWAIAQEIAYMSDGTVSSIAPTEYIVRAEMAYALMQFHKLFVGDAE